MQVYCQPGEFAEVFAWLWGGRQWFKIQLFVFRATAWPAVGQTRLL